MKYITKKIIVPASLSKVWNCWTTEEGIKSFFARDCRIESKLNGNYEIYFNPDAQPGLKGAEGMKILIYQKNEILSFTWTAPPSIPEIRGQMNQVLLEFIEIDENHTELSMNHVGWPDSPEWIKAYDYFDKAWKKIVLPRLIYRFEKGPINWDNPPETND